MIIKIRYIIMYFYMVLFDVLNVNFVLLLMINFMINLKVLR